MAFGLFKKKKEEEAFNVGELDFRPDIPPTPVGERIPEPSEFPEPPRAQIKKDEPIKMPEPVFPENELPELPELEEEKSFEMPPVPTSKPMAPVPMPPASAPMPMPPVPRAQAPAPMPMPPVPRAEPVSVEPIPLPVLRRPVPSPRPVLEQMPSERIDEKLKIDITKFVRLKDYKRVKEELSKLKGVVTELIDSLEKLSTMEEKEKEHLRNAESAMRDAERIIKQVDTTLANSPKE